MRGYINQERTLRNDSMMSGVSLPFLRYLVMKG